VVKPTPPADRGPRGPIGPSGGGPSLEEMRAELARLSAAAPKGRRAKGHGAPPLMAELAEAEAPGAYSRPGKPVDPTIEDQLRGAMAGAYERPIAPPPELLPPALAPGTEGLAPIALESRVFGPRVPERVPAAGLDVYGSPADPPRDRYGKLLSPVDPEMDRLEKQVESMVERQLEDVKREKARRLVAAIASEVMAPERRQLERLDTAVRRAIGLIQPTAGNFVGTDPMRALAVLRECLIPETEGAA